LEKETVSHYLPPPGVVLNANGAANKYAVVSPVLLQLSRLRVESILREQKHFLLSFLLSKLLTNIEI
jgi:hypothetical protein